MTMQAIAIEWPEYVMEWCGQAEMLIYHDHAALTSWTINGETPENMNALVHLIWEENRLTVATGLDARMAILIERALIAATIKELQSTRLDLVEANAELDDAWSALGDAKGGTVGDAIRSLIKEIYRLREENENGSGLRGWWTRIYRGR